MPKQKPKVTNDDIARRAYEISESGDRGSDDENWHRAERELRGEGEPDGPWAKTSSGDMEHLTDES